MQSSLYQEMELGEQKNGHSQHSEQSGQQSNNSHKYKQSDSVYWLKLFYSKSETTVKQYKYLVSAVQYSTVQYST